ncbi:helix-turn-helix domain-containing protein [Microbacterium indicum]|uniref:helix-turn-helix domain-containing protein n=1 Tax=Microbacterium indicum TaxID=358100 RepID=UPI0003FC8499|nr:helix-turn-helix domain-containing protein [Microbacterium indicum]
MSITRVELTFEANYTQIPNAWLRDARLSHKARGVLAELMTHRAGWKTSIEQIAAAGPDGVDAIRAAIRELENAGYLRREQRHDNDGRFAETDFLLQEPPLRDYPSTGHPSTGHPSTGHPSTGNPTPKKTKDKKTSTEEDQGQELSRDAIRDAFARAWGSWPKQTRRKPAEAAFATATKIHDPDWLADQIARHAAAYGATLDPARKRYVPALAAWIREERWDDPLETMLRPPTDTAWQNALTPPPEHVHRWLTDGTCMGCIERRTDSQEGKRSPQVPMYAQEGSAADARP